MAAGNAVALPARGIGLAVVGRIVVGFGTGLGFVAGSDYIRARGGSPFLQGVYGSSSVLAPGIAIALVPGLATWIGFRAPYLSGVIVAVACAVVLTFAPPFAKAPLATAASGSTAASSATGYLLRLAAIHAASFGFSVVVGNWVVTLLEHHGRSKEFAAAAGSLTLLLAFFSRIGGGALLRRADASRWVALSLVLGGAGAVALALPLPVAALVAAAAVIGLASGVPFPMAFSGAQLDRPKSPGAAVGFVNAWAAFVIVVGAPLVGLTFSLPGDGRLGFVVLGVLAALGRAPDAAWRPPADR